ncbi:de3bee04-c6bb-4d9b-8f86-cc9d88a2d201 [Thermothielavioides terrestris]|uniref:De3bee04-c6bb-4d9b-8f86-cc9d88a2d201 n=1 Tax=Thermothielavioides terrestris TaxID=2587410 RepID=A0A3S4EY11_9PEZI|nr:de3bee04-c6bb-4d9b-8f86-cc9d88a2d201 [Thermothielavioides terrestris]
MAAVSLPVVARDTFSQITKRSNWASRNAGVMVVFCIVFIVGVGLIGLFIHKKLQARREKRQQISGTSNEVMAHYE